MVIVPQVNVDDIIKVHGHCTSGEC
jgi:hypothetical protein